MSEAKMPDAIRSEPVGMTFDELPIQARLRFVHAERWVAWAEDDQSVIAVADTHQEVRDAARRAGFPHALCEWIPPVPIRPIGR